MKKVLAIFLVIIFLGCGGGNSDNSSSQTDNHDNYYLLNYVVDGDTLNFEQLGKVRLISIDTPESYNSSRLDRQAEKCADGNKTIIQTMGKKATSYIKSFLEEGEEYYVENYGQDRYGRVVGKVFIENQSVNLKMVKDGYAVPYIYNEGEDSDEELIIDAYKKAKNSNRGLWLKYSKEMECLYNLNNSK